LAASFAGGFLGRLILGSLGEGVRLLTLFSRAVFNYEVKPRKVFGPPSLVRVKLFRGIKVL
jgi:hypothetical protein